MQSFLCRCAGLMLVGLLALPLAASAGTRDWMPESITLPDNHEVILDQKIGSRTHILQILVEFDPTPMLAEWQAALEADGYEINDSMLFDGRLLFSDSRVESGQIAVQEFDETEFMIQVDVSLSLD